jgi:transcriptional regulator with XRE-family HTH domain
MRPKSSQRLLAEKLRREQGLSYRDIAVRLNLSKSTLSGWLKDISLTPAQAARLQKRQQENRAGFATRASPINRQRYTQARQAAYQAGAEVVARLPEATQVDELAFALLYLGEGTKGRGKVQVASMDADILRFVCWALRQLYRIDESRLSLRLNLIELARSREKTLIGWWARALGVAPGQFTKTQFDARSAGRRVSRDYRGVCTVTYSDTYLQQHILGLGQAYVRARTDIKIATKEP